MIGICDVSDVSTVWFGHLSTNDSLTTSPSS